MPSYTARELERDTGFDRRTIAYYVQEGLLPKVGRRGPRTRYPKLVRDRLLFIRRVREAEEEGEVPAVTLSDMRKVFERVPPALIAGVADGRIAVSPELVAEPSTAFRTPGMRRRALKERWGGGEGPIGRMRAPGRRMSRPRAPADMADVEEPVGDEVYRTAGLRESEADEERELGVVRQREADDEREFEAVPQREADVPEVFSPLPDDAVGWLREGPREESPTDMVSGLKGKLMEARTAEHGPVYGKESIFAESLQHLQEVARRRNEESPGSRNTWTRIEISPDIVLSVRGITEEDEEVVDRVRRAMARVIRGGEGVASLGVPARLPHCGPRLPTTAPGTLPRPRRQGSRIGSIAVTLRCRQWCSCPAGSR